MACEIPAGQDYVVKTVNFVATRKTSNLAETFFLQYTGAALHQRYSGLHEPWGVCWSRQVFKSCPLSLQEFSHRQFSIMGSSRFFSNRKSLTDKKILWRTCIVPRDVNDWDGETSIKVNIWLFSEACPRIKRIHLTRWLRRLTFGLLAFFSFRSSSKALFPSLRCDHMAAWHAFFNNFVVEIEWCPGCCIHTSPQGAWRPAWQDLCLREPQPSCTTPQHGGLGPSITWHDQVLNTDGRFNLQHLTCLG